jgi:hypothetical protein
LDQVRIGKFSRPGKIFPETIIETGQIDKRIVRVITGERREDER